MDESYLNLVEKFKLMSSSTLAKHTKIFRLTHPNAKDGSEHEHPLTINDCTEEYKFSLKGRICCSGCNIYHPTYGDCYNEYDEEYDPDELYEPSHFNTCGFCGERMQVVTCLTNWVGDTKMVCLKIAIEKRSPSKNQTEQTHIANIAKVMSPNEISNKCFKIWSPVDNFLQQNGDLIFLCQITLSCNKHKDPLANKKPNKKDLPRSQGVLEMLAKRFSEANINPSIPNDELADVVLHVDENKIYCHKLILSMGSKVFNKMFTTDMEEKKSNDVFIEDVDIQTLKSLLSFMYSDVIPETEITVQLLAASDKYEVMRLREICEEKLSLSVDIENVAEIWHVAYLHNVEELEQDALAFMAVNWKKLRHDEKVKKLIKTCPHLTETISALLSDEYQ